MNFEGILTARKFRVFVLGLKVNRECRGESTGARESLVLTDYGNYRYAKARSRYCTCAGNRTLRTGSGLQERTPSIEVRQDDPLSLQNGWQSGNRYNIRRRELIYTLVTSFANMQCFLCERNKNAEENVRFCSEISQ